MKGYKKRGSRYINPNIQSTKRSLVEIALWQLGYYNDRKVATKVPSKFRYPNSKRKLRPKAPTVTWINHCTFLIHVDGLNILTDPIWSDRCSPLPFLGPKRMHEPPLALKDLPHIDLVFISHDHYDHLDRKTVRYLHQQYPNITWVVPLGMKRWLKKQGMKNVLELDWWEKTKIDFEGREVDVTAVPSQHFSGRGIFDKNCTLWSGFVIDFIRPKKQRKRLYFVGDTGYNHKDFKAIGKYFGHMDLSLIPIGTYIPRAFMDPVHIDPVKSVAIHSEVHSNLSVGMHWKTFRLSGEGLDQPPYDLYRALEKKEIDPKSFRVLDPGQTINW